MEHSGQMDDAWQPKCHDLIPVRQLAQKETADRTDVLRLGFYCAYGTRLKIPASA
jgi:hypothetical protein